MMLVVVLSPDGLVNMPTVTDFWHESSSSIYFRLQNSNVCRRVSEWLVTYLLNLMRLEMFSQFQLTEGSC
jgi:hypothetical protein